jgi:GNAT superfamily N-acetyltransferase
MERVCATEIFRWWTYLRTLVVRALAAYAFDNQRRNLSRTFVLVDHGGQVIGYYSLTMGGVRREELPPRYGRGLPRYEIGMVLLARLAIDQGHQGMGTGRALLIEAIERAAAAGEHAAARFISIDPIDENAQSFYSAFGVRLQAGAGGRRWADVPAHRRRVGSTR